MEFGYNILSDEALGANGNSNYVEAIEAKNSGGSNISSPTVETLNQRNTTTP
jgi:hypothetical protein